jgi:3-dehydroquinate synthase
MRVDVSLGQRSYPIHIGSGLIDVVGEYVAPLVPSSILIVTNEVVARFHEPRVRAGLANIASVATVALADGERAKNWASVARVIDALVAHGADRSTVVVALGGGVIGDVAGFAASIFMRGIRVVQLPTTLLAQVDSSVGGKTGINHPTGKNLIGTFHQPSVVVADTDVLRTLPARELAAGLAEVLKHGLLADAAYFDEVVAALPRLRACDPAALTQAIARSCEIKAGVVGRDEREAGERALLNLGHTFGHAIEAMTGFSQWLHGEAVGCGLVLAAELSQRLELLQQADVRRIEHAIAHAGLPPRIEGLSLEGAMNAMRGDKKAHAGKVRYIVLERVGRALQRTVPEALVRETLRSGGFR